MLNVCMIVPLLIGDIGNKSNLSILSTFHSTSSSNRIMWISKNVGLRMSNVDSICSSGVDIYGGVKIVHCGAIIGRGGEDSSFGLMITKICGAWKSCIWCTKVCGHTSGYWRLCSRTVSRFEDVRRKRRAVSRTVSRILVSTDSLC